nr:uncharacterized protein LOC129387234 isoform X3 [Dermacentor andersoni]
MFRQRRLRASFQHFSLLHGPRQLRCQFSGSCQRIARRIFLLARSSSLVGSGHSGYNEQQHAARSQRDPHVVDWGYDRHRRHHLTNSHFRERLVSFMCHDPDPRSLSAVSLQERPVPQRGSISLVSRQACLYRAGLCRPEKFRLFRIG